MSTTSDYSFFQSVEKSFDKASKFTNWENGLLEQIKACNSIYSMRFPVKMDDGHIEVKLFENEVWVSPFFWNTCDYNAKRNLAYFCAIKCANAQNETLYYCTVRDKKDGKKLGKYSHAWGFEVE